MNMTKSTSSTPTLEGSVQKLKQHLSEGVARHSAATAAQVFTSSLHLLNELKKDQATLHRIRRNASSDDDCQCPPEDEIPAISAVVQDPGLFRALIRCLQTATLIDSSAVESASGGAPGLSVASGGNNTNLAGRKRSLSMSSESSSMGVGGNKSMKIGHHQSPVPMSRKNTVSMGKKPAFNLQILAATILYTAFQHLDHWPVPLVKAYAEDCFGPRLWVDSEHCAILTENLALSHSSSISDDQFTDMDIDLADAVAADAASMAASYRQFQASLQTGTEDWSVKDDAASSKASYRRHLSSASSCSVDSSGAKKSNELQQNVNSDSGIEVHNSVELSLSDRPNAKSKQGDSDSSSSGEEDEPDVSAIVRGGSGHGSTDKDGKMSSRNTSTNGAHKNHVTSLSDDGKRNLFEVSSTLYPVVQKNLNLTRVRQRFFGANLESAREAITSTLSDRLDVKSKQNSGLLSCLPGFTSLPGVRRLIGRNLEKWLQSPALAGLARSLFSATVRQMKNVDPPLEEDLLAIESILGMRLKANQLNAHIENVKAIAKSIPVASVPHRMYSTLFREALRQMEHGDIMNSDQLKMIVAIHREVSSQFSYDAAAAALLMLLADAGANEDSAVARRQLVKKLRGIIRALAAQLGSSFDGCLLVDALLSFDVNKFSWSARDEEDKARLMFQCITLSVSPYIKKVNGTKLVEKEELDLRKTLNSARKLLLTWCCTEYGPRHSAKLAEKRSKSEAGENDVAGAGPADFSSALGPASAYVKIPRWLNTMRCMLFIEDAESPLMKGFMAQENSGIDEADWEQELVRIRLCCKYGRETTDSLVWIILKSVSRGSLDANMAVQLLEHMFECCSKNNSGSLNISDPNIVWELYNLVQYNPKKSTLLSKSSSQSDGSEVDDETSPASKKVEQFPRLAYPGLWWRVTMLALVMCGYAPEKIGSVVWNEHPTVRALVKMVTSGRYRFPTVDCDENSRIDMKKLEQSARDMETSVAEFLFLPKKEKKTKTESRGSRVSQRLRKQQQEKEAARQVEEASRRKKQLRSAQRSIMLWDPDGPARKPPRECVDLLLSVEELFDLADIFQRSLKPDFLLMTIGQTTRGAIERAYDWLIPIISKYPDTIARLPSNASCFLLLRAYGTDGEERKQLNELSAPLLLHVQDCLQGKHGESASVKAFDLLMSDVASKKSDRRRCARRVLRDALVQSEASGSNTHAWMHSILHVDYANSLVGNAVKYMSLAAVFERGRVLSSLLMALEQHIAFAEKNKIATDETFPELLVRLISTRPAVCAEAMDISADLRSLAIRTVHSEFLRFCKASVNSEYQHDIPSVVVRTFKTPLHDGGTMRLPLSLLHSLSVVLSIWKEAQSETDEEAKSFVTTLADAFLRSDGETPADDDVGLASARMLEGDGTGVSVESWIMLAKARSDSFAKRAALSAPERYLSRLLLCSGLPRASLLTMIDRLGRLGDSVDKKDDIYLKLLAPSASSEWDAGRVASRREIARKLLGRLSAYLRLNNISLRSNSDVSTTFLTWLTDQCKVSDIKKPSKSSKTRFAPEQSLCSLGSSSAILSMIENGEEPTVTETIAETDDMKMIDFKLEERPAPAVNECETMDDARSFVKKCFQDHHFITLDRWLGKLTAEQEKASFKSDTNKVFDLVELAVIMLAHYQVLEHPQCGATMNVLKWVPRLTCRSGKPELWRLIFLSSPGWSRSTASSSLLSNCVSSWSMMHASRCREWIMTLGDDGPSNIDFERIAGFLVATSQQPTPQVELFSMSSSMSSTIEWANSREFVTFGTNIALKSLQQSPEGLEKLANHRNCLPSGFVLVFLLARCGKRQLRSVADTVLQQISSMENENSVQDALDVLFLRLYLRHPSWMDLGSSTARTVLMRASERNSSSWVDWRSSFDDKLDDMLDTMSSGDLKMTRALSEVSRKHPLLFLRKIAAITSLLEADATMTSDDRSDQRGIVKGQNMSGSREVKFHGRTVKVRIQHWGYSFTEPLWLAFLDILSSIPREVLFSCGLKVGLLDFLEVYLLLMSVQLQLLSANKAARLKAKLGELFSVFQQCNRSAWSDWLESKIGTNEVRHILMSCDFITPQEAIESLKNGATTQQ